MHLIHWKSADVIKKIERLMCYTSIMPFHFAFASDASARWKIEDTLCHHSSVKKWLNPKIGSVQERMISPLFVSFLYFCHYRTANTIGAVCSLWQKTSHAEESTQLRGWLSEDLETQGSFFAVFTERLIFQIKQELKAFLHLISQEKECF